MAIKELMKTDYLTFDAGNSITEMLGKLKSSGKRTGLVYNKGKFIGVVNYHSLLKTSLSLTESKIVKCAVKTPLVSVNADVYDTAMLMAESNLDFLPVVEDNNIIGIVRSLDLLQAAAKMPEMRDLKVKDIKFAKPTALKDTDKISEVLKVMMKQKVEQVPVFQGRNLTGVIRIADMINLFLSPQKASRGKALKEVGKTRSAAVDRTKMSSLPIKSFITSNVSYIKRNDRLNRTINSMGISNLWDMMVSEEGKVYGLLTVKNILGKFASLKPVDEPGIKFHGLNETHLTERQAGMLKDIAENEAGKIQRVIKNDLVISVHVKEHKQSGKPGKKHKYSVTLRLEYPGRIVTGTQDDWKVQTAMRKAFNNVKNKLGSQFKD
ncbi:MAG: CBS domain-containing protein [archaeon]|nr:CBS domain-containing protein [Nanoarchaeota archaeon]